MLGLNFSCNSVNGQGYDTKTIDVLFSGSCGIQFATYSWNYVFSSGYPNSTFAEPLGVECIAIVPEDGYSIYVNFTDIHLGTEDCDDSRIEVRLVKSRGGHMQRRHRSKAPSATQIKQVILPIKENVI